jgi:uncharacterized protein YcbK (DUF882 family)
MGTNFAPAFVLRQMMGPIDSEHDLALSRRRFLGLAVAGIGGWICGSAWAGPFEVGLDEPDFWARPRSLDLVRVQTGERLTVAYWADGALRDEGYEQVCHLLRDVRVNRSTRIDPVLLDKLWASQALAARHGVHRPLEILSAYRTPATNRRVGGARASLHTKGRAVDYRIPGLRPQALARMLRGFRVGGVGAYRRSGSSGWVHADTGDPRDWRG